MDTFTIKSKADSKVAYYKNVITKYANDLMHDPRDTVARGNVVVDAVSRLTVWQEVAESLRVGLDVQSLIERLQKYALQRASRPSNGCLSPPENHLELETTAAYAEVCLDLTNLVGLATQAEAKAVPTAAKSEPSYPRYWFEGLLWFFWHDGRRIYNPYLSPDRTRRVDPCTFYGFEVDPGGEPMLSRDFGDVIIWLGTGHTPAASAIPTEEDAANGRVMLGAWGSSRDGKACQWTAHSLPTDVEIQEFEQHFASELAEPRNVEPLERTYRRLYEINVQRLKDLNYSGR